MSLRVLIADDEELVRTGLAMILGAEPGVDVVGAAADGDEAVRLVHELDPDVLLLDIRMPVRDGLQTVRALRADGVGTPVVMLTTFETDAYVVEALRSGATGFLLKDAPADRLVAALRAAAGGDAVLAPSVARRVAAELGRHRRSDTVESLSRLTERERDVLDLMAEGLSNAEIATRLVISEER